MKELKKNIIFIFFLVLLNSCQTTSIKNNNPPNIVETIAAKNNLTHIAMQCQLYNLKGQKILNLLGHLCLFEESGHSLVLRNQELSYYSPDLKLIWKKPYRLHHHLSQSVFTDHYLSIDSHYEVHHKYKKMRYDVLVVIDKNGNVVKKFNFKDYIKQQQKADLIAAAKNDWTDDQNAKNSYELTHVNSFYELYLEKENKRVHSGYVAHSLMHQKLFIFDVHLQKIEEVVDLQKRGVHDVQPLNQNELVFYVNNKNHLNWIENKYSYIETYNLKSKEFKTLHANNSEYLISLACSSVQPLNKALFIVHSACKPNSQQKKIDTRLEFVDLKTGQSQLLHLENSGSFALGKLINAEAYLKLSYGR